MFLELLLSTSLVLDTIVTKAQSWARNAPYYIKCKTGYLPQAPLTPEGNAFFLDENNTFVHVCRKYELDSDLVGKPHKFKTPLWHHQVHDDESKTLYCKWGYQLGIYDNPGGDPEQVEACVKKSPTS